MVPELRPQNENAFLSVYERLREREQAMILSEHPAEAAKQLSGQLGLQPATAARFEKAYIEYAQEQHRQHVAKHNPGGSQMVNAGRSGSEIFDDMAGILADSQSKAFLFGEDREQAVRQYLRQALHSPSAQAASDASFLHSTRRLLDEKPGAQEKFDAIIVQMQSLNDGVLDPAKISQYTGPLLGKQSKDLARLLYDEGVKDSQAIGNRMLNIFTKQVDLGQGRLPESKKR